jgi:hypothetical protein
MANQQITRTRDLALGKHFEATLWASEPPIRAGGQLFLVPSESNNYDGMFEFADSRLLQHMSKYGSMIEAYGFEKESIRVVADCASDSDPHIYFRWADKFD